MLDLAEMTRRQPAHVHESNSRDWSETSWDVSASYKFNGRMRSSATSYWFLGGVIQATKVLHCGPKVASTVVPGFDLELSQMQRRLAMLSFF